MKKTGTLVIILVLLLSAQAVGETQWFAIAPNAVLPAGEDLSATYPCTLTRGEKTCDEQELIVSLLGEDYETEARTQWANADEYTQSKQGRNPWEYRRVSVYDDGGEFTYYDPWVAGERGGEYEAPDMNMTMQESTLLARALAGQYLDESFLAHPSTWLQIRERWSYAGRWMTEKEYEAFVCRKKTHSIVFSEVSAAGVPVLDENVMVVIGVNGLSELFIRWHEFTESEDTVSVMSIEEALAMADSTRQSETTLLSAQIVYSNRVTMGLGRPDEFNIGWLLITSEGNYFVDSVENAHICDSYEY